MLTLVFCGLICLAPWTPNFVPSTEARTLTSEEQRSVKLFNSNTSSVVNVTNIGMSQDAFTLDIMEIPQGAGTGIIWDKKGHIITNFHVIRQATEVQITLSGGEQVMASVVGVDPDKDVAVLKIKAESTEELQPIKVGTSSDLFVGQQVYAIGNPFGLDHTLTSGIISGTEREITGANDRPIQGVIQTDAAINPGNSGGPLLDSGGSLIGMNTAIYSPSGASSGVGFAIPVDIVKSSVDQILAYGRVIRPFLGISFASDRSIDQLGVKGILILRVQQGSPADKAGLQGTYRDDAGRLHLGDVIIQLNDQNIKTSSDLFRKLDQLSVGDEVKLKVMRQDAVKEFTILLEEKRETRV
eukprot:g3398.t1